MIMKQTSLGTSGFERRPLKTSKQIFLEEMNQVVPWEQLVALIEPHAPKPGAKGGRPPFAVPTMLRIHFLQQWFNLSDRAMEEGLHDVPLFRDFAGLDIGRDHLPDESTILRFRHLLERHRIAEQILNTVNGMLTAKGLMLKAGTVIDATIIAAPSSTKNKEGKRDPEMHQTKKGKQWYFGMKMHIGADADSGLVHTPVGTAANVHDITQAVHLLHGQESDVHADSGFRGVAKRSEIIEAHPDVNWHIGMTPGNRRSLDKDTLVGKLTDALEKTKASIRAKVEHPFWVVKVLWGHSKVRYRGLAKNTAQYTTLFALSNLWMVRKSLMKMQQA